MGRKRGFILAFLLFLSSFQYAYSQQNRLRTPDAYPIHNLNTRLNYTSVQEAIDASETSDGHTILVDAGTYYGKVILSKSVHLVGQDKETTIIDGNGTGKVIIVMIDNTSVSNLTIRGGGYLPYYEDHSAIYVNSSNNLIADNILRNNRDYAVFLDASRKNTIENNIMIDNWRNCMLEDSTENKVIGNKILGGNQECVSLFVSSGNKIDSNLMYGGTCGVNLYEANDNVIVGNTINHTFRGIEVYSSYRNTIYHNNFINSRQASAYLFSSSGSNFFDSDLEGNYWDDYNETDGNCDGLGDTPFILDENNTDHYPLMGAFQSYSMIIENPNPLGFEEVYVISNCTVGSVDYSLWSTTDNPFVVVGSPVLILHPVTGETGTVGFCRIFLANSILKTSNYVVVVDMQNATVRQFYGLGDAYTWLYFTFSNPVNDRIVITRGSPSSPPPSQTPITTIIVLALCIVVALLSVMLYRKKHRN